MSLSKLARSSVSLTLRSGFNGGAQLGVISSAQKHNLPFPAQRSFSSTSDIKFSQAVPTVTVSTQSIPTPYNKKPYNSQQIRFDIDASNSNKEIIGSSSMDSGFGSPRSQKSFGTSSAASKQQTQQSTTTSHEFSDVSSSFDVKNHIPAGPVVKNNNIIAQKGEGCWVWDQDGKKYLDMTAGIGVLSTGHCHPHIVAAIKEQCDTLMHAQQSMFFSHTQQNKLFERLLPLFPSSHDQFLLTNSGSEATENAIKVARMATGKSNVICLHKGFHGRTFGAMSWSSSKTNYRMGFQPMMPGAFFVPQMTPEDFDAILDHQTAGSETCAVILEPVQGEGGIHKVPIEFLQHVRKRCDENGMLLVYDEVQSGVGRTGTFWGYEKALADHVTEQQAKGVDNVELPDVTPDIIAFAKGIGSGFPIGGISGSKELFSRMTKNALGSTYGGSALGCAAANATLDVIFQENLMENSKKMGALIKENLMQMPLVQDVRQHGLFIGADIDPLYPVGQIVKKASEEQAMVLHTCGRNALRIIPPLVINAEEVEIFSHKLESILKELQATGKPGEMVGATTM